MQYTPTVLVVLFQEGKKKIAQIEGSDKIRAAIRSGAAEALISAFMEERVKLRMADRLAEQLAMRLALGLAVAGAVGARAAAAKKSSAEDELKEKFEKEMEKEIKDARQQRAEHLHEDDDDKSEVSIVLHCSWVLSCSIRMVEEGGTKRGSPGLSFRLCKHAHA